MQLDSFSIKVIQQLADGKPTKVIYTETGIHRCKLDRIIFGAMKTLKAVDRVHLVAIAMRKGIVV